VKYQAEIDGLRAFAVFSVIGYHYFPERITGGFVGVDVFFVISGFLITTILLKDIDSSDFSIRRFYERRVRRIFPALLIVLLSVLVFGWYSLLEDEYAVLGKHVAGGSVFLSNIIYWNEAGYFDTETIEKPLLHLWSLGVEEQFYLIWPLVLWIGWRYKNISLGIIIFILLTSLAYSNYELSRDLTLAYYSPLSRLWELMAGSCLAYITYAGHVNPNKLSTFRANLVTLFALALILASVFNITDKTPFPGLAAAPVVLGTALLIYVANTSTANTLIFGNKVAVWFGLISYPLYLWHWPLISFGYLYYSEFPGRAYRILALLVAIVLAWATYYFVEKQVRKNNSNMIVVVLLLLNVLLLVGGVEVYRNKGFPERASIQDIDFSVAARDQFTGFEWPFIKNQQCMTEYPFELSDTLQWWFCMKSSEKPATIAIIGNSFANQLYPGFAQNPSLSHHTILSIGTCDFGGEPRTEDPGSTCFGDRALKQAAFIDNLLMNSNSIKFVIVDGLMRNPDKDYIDRVAKRISKLEDAGLKVVVFTPHFQPKFHPRACFSSPLRKETRDCSFNTDERIRLYESFLPLIRNISISNPGVLFFEQNDVFCDEKSCSYVRDSMPLNRDRTHTSEFASMMLQKYFTLWARKNLPELLVSP